jgi:hypothetical protein
MQTLRCRVATMVLSISVLAFPASRGLVIADDPKGHESRDATLREGIRLMISSAIESSLKQAIEDSMRALELNDPIEKGIYVAALCSDGDGDHHGSPIVGRCTASIVLMRPANNRESQKTLKHSSGDLDVALTKIRTRNVRSETATATIFGEVEGGFEVLQSSFVYDSKQGWKKVETTVSSQKRQAK